MPQSPWSRPPEYCDDYVLSPHQQAMVEACKDGHVAALQTLFQQHGVHYGDHALGSGNRYQRITSTGAPRTADLFEPAIANGNLAVVQYLHLVYPEYDFLSSQIILALLKSADPEMLKLIHSYSPEVVHLHVFGHLDTFLSKACEGGPAKATFVNVLLDLGVTDGGEDSYSWRFGGALNVAIHHDQPIEILRRMAPLTDHLGFPILTACDKKRYDVVELLLRTLEKRPMQSWNLKAAQRDLDNARTKGDRKLVALYTRHNRVVKDKLEQAEKVKEANEARAKGINIPHEKAEGQRRTSWWWKSRTMPMSTTGEDGVEGQSSQSNQSNDSRWWWPLSKRGRQPGSKEFPGPGKQVDDSSSGEENEEIA